MLGPFSTSRTETELQASIDLSRKLAAQVTEQDLARRLLALAKEREAQLDLAKAALPGRWR